MSNFQEAVFGSNAGRPNDYIDEIRQLLTELKAAKDKIDDQHVIAIITSGLPSSYLHWCNSWDQCDDDKQTLQECFQEC